MKTSFNLNYGLNMNTQILNSDTSFKAGVKTINKCSNKELIKNLNSLGYKGVDVEKCILEMIESFSSPMKVKKIFNKYGKEALLERRDDKHVNYIDLLCSKSSNPKAIQKAVELFGEDAFLSCDEGYMSALELACKNNPSRDVITKLTEIFGENVLVLRAAYKIQGAFLEMLA